MKAPRYRVQSGEMDLVVNAAPTQDEAVLKALRGTRAKSLGSLYSVRRVDNAKPCRATFRGGARPVVFYGRTVPILEKVGRLG